MRVRIKEIDEVTFKRAYVGFTWYEDFQSKKEIPTQEELITVSLVLDGLERLLGGDGWFIYGIDNYLFKVKILEE